MKKRSIFFAMGIFGLFSSCNFQKEEASTVKTEAPAIVIIQKRSLFDSNSGNMECFHDQTSEKEFDIACHAYVKQEDGSKDLADAIANGLVLKWLPPVVEGAIEISNLNCFALQKNLGYRCHMITNESLSSENSAKVKITLSLEGSSSEGKKLDSEINLSEQNSIPPELDAILIGENFDAGNSDDTFGRKISSGSNVDNPFGEPKIHGIVAHHPKQVAPKAAAPIPVPVSAPVSSPSVSLDPVWFDNLDEEGNEKVSLQCKQEEILADAQSEEVPFRVHCLLIGSSEQLSLLQQSTVKIEGFSFPEGKGSNRMACTASASGYLCLGAISKESLDLAENQKPFARVELKLFNAQEYRLFTRNTALDLMHNSRQ